MSKWVELKALTDRTAKTIANWIFEDVISNRGCPY